MPYDRDSLPTTACVRQVLRSEYHPDTMLELRRVFAHCLIRDQEAVESVESLQRATKATQRPLA